VQKLQDPNYQKKLEQCNAIIRSAKGLKGLSDFGPWKEATNIINDRIEALKRHRDSILLGINKDISTDRELAEVKSIAREIKVLGEIRDIEKSYTKGVNEALKEKEKLTALIEKEKAKPKRKFSL